MKTQGVKIMASVSLRVKLLTPQLVVETLHVEPAGLTASDVLDAVLEHGGVTAAHTRLCCNGRVLAAHDAVTATDTLVVLNIIQLHVAAALAAAHGDPARAAELLRRPSGGRRSNATVQELGRAARAASVARELAGNAQQMAMLRRMPEVQRLLRMPRLAGISERPEELQRLLRRVLLSPEFQRSMRDGTVTDEMLEEALGDGGGGGGGGGEGSSAASRAERFVAMAEQRRRLNAEHSSGAVALSAEEEAAVARLMALGQFSRRRALEAFLACEKDEGLAASLLFSSEE